MIAFYDGPLGVDLPEDGARKAPQMIEYNDHDTSLFARDQNDVLKFVDQTFVVLDKKK